MNRHGLQRSLFAAFGACVVLFAAGAGAKDRGPAFTTDFQIERCTFSSRGDNPFFVLDGGRLVLEGDDDGDIERVEITVTNDLERIELPGAGTLFARVVEEREWVNGTLIEVSRNFFATCEETNDVFYFGEEVDIYHDDGTVTHDGAWRAGEPDANGVAEPGIIMPGRFLLGARYFQEIAEGTAMDRAENAEMGLDVTTPAGEFHDCVKVVETTPLEPKAVSVKLYCPGIGLVYDDGVELVEYHRQ
ncbi:MAG: hypothetical protein HYU52_04115 [Acidobacteria bacterium]|nr:hypothetical protein [Acidobacteriota bacterium]